MDIKRELRFLKAVAANNNRQWFQEHKDEYTVCKDDFQSAVSEVITKFSTFDEEIASQTAKDCCYRFYRDVRFSADKSPYKRHFAHISVLMGGRRCVEDIISMYNQGIASLPLVAIGSQQTYLHRHATRL